MAQSALDRGLIVCGYPGVGKTSASGCRRSIIDLESSWFQKDDIWYSEYAKVAIELAGQGFTVCTSMHSEVLDIFARFFDPAVPSGVPMDYNMYGKCGIFGCVIVVPDKSLKKEWEDRLVRRYEESGSDKDKRALKRSIDKFDRDISGASGYGLPVKYLTSTDYQFEDVIDEIRMEYIKKWREGSERYSEAF